MKKLLSRYATSNFTCPEENIPDCTTDVYLFCDKLTRYDTKKRNGSSKLSRFIFLRRCVTRGAVEKQPLA